MSNGRLLLLMGRKKYYQRVLSVRRANLISYRPLWEASGTAIQNLANPAFTGTYSNVTLGAAGIGDGRTAASFNGTTSYANIYSASLAGAFNKDEGTLAMWVRVNSAAAWTDSTSRRVVVLQADGNNVALITKDSGANTLIFRYVAGGTTKQVAVGSQTSTAWMALAMTWSKSSGANGELKAYINGAQVGTTQTGLGTWAGALAATTALIGAGSQVPVNVWHGWLAHSALWTAALSAAEVARLVTGYPK